MKKSTALFLLLMPAALATAQVQQDINEQVWKPFVAAFNNNDTENFMAVHSRDAVRSPRDSREVLNWDQYFAQQKKGDERGKATGSKRELELRFTERLAGKDLAVEVGVYRTTSIRPDGVARSFYGRFHVVLRKENGTWKILVDTDSSEGGSISEKDFLAASPME